MKKFLILVTVLFLLFAAFQIYRQNQWLRVMDSLGSPTINDSKIVKTEEIQISDPIEVKPDPITGEINTNDWPIYRNETLGFEIKYPNGWGIIHLERKKDRSHYFAIKSVSHDADVGLGVIAAETAEGEIARVIEEDRDNLLSQEPILIAGFPATRLVFSTDDSQLIYVRYFLSFDAKVYSIYGFLNNNQDVLLDTIVKHFKLL
ncbi:MAG: hypothetical protein HYT47_02815 [Candidatus Vogelbacteria bacterium]|nr:hypothetical protein [Candidatus Vogelbacteria bacterium]